METNLNQRTISNKGTYQTLIIISSIGIIISFMSSYISGIEPMRIYYRIIDWCSGLALAILISKFCDYINVFSKKRTLSFLPYLILISPLLYSLDFLIVRIDFGNYRYVEFFYSTVSFLSGLIQVLVTIVLIRELKVINLLVANLTSSDKDATKSQTGKEKNNEKVDVEIKEQLLGRGNTILDKVITSILYRANASNRVISFTLVIMLVIVAIGGSASFGTVALNEAKKIRELESERLKMLDIVHTIQTADSSKLAERNKELREIITSRYGDENSYKNIVENIEKQSYVSWPDIAMRITIAALTLFLVQIFFHIYKYNQQQSSHLFTKAETLELYKETGADQGELRIGLLSKVDSNPKFDKAPTTPTEQFFHAINKAKDAKSG